MFNEIILALIPAVAAVAIFVIGYYKSQRDEAQKDKQELIKQAEKAKEGADAQASPFSGAAAANKWLRSYRDK